MAFVPHDVDDVPNVMIHSHGVTFPTASGISGGHPGAINRLAVERRTNIKDLFGRGILPGDPAEITAEEHETPPPFSYSNLTSCDVFVSAGGGGGGYGDPLDREPESVLRDVRKGLVSNAAAEMSYGVIVSNGIIDEAATNAKRSDLRKGRSREAKPADFRPLRLKLSTAEPTGRINEYLAVARRPDGMVVHCRCGCVLCSIDDDYRTHLPIRDVTTRANVLGPVEAERVPFYSIKEYFCPKCWTLVDTQVFVAVTKP
jgi:N-methylhydantoinase B